MLAKGARHLSFHENVEHRSHKISVPPPHCTEIDFALSFGAVLVKMIDLSKTESRDFFGIILGQENSQKLYLLPKSC